MSSTAIPASSSAAYHVDQAGDAIEHRHAEPSDLGSSSGSRAADRRDDAASVGQLGRVADHHLDPVAAGQRLQLVR